MSLADLYREPVVLDRKQHRGKRLLRSDSVERLATQNLSFVAVGEFAEVAKEFVIGFVPAAPPGAEGAGEVTPVVLLGLRERENLYVGADGRWETRYVPAFLRRYPFVYGRSAEGQPTVMIDASFPGFNDTEGELLVQDDGEPAPFLQQTIRFLDQFEQEVQRTRAACARIVELGLLKSVQVDVALPDGRKFNATGLQVVDEAKLRELPEATVAELLRSGLLLVLHAHLLSASNIHRLTEKLAVRLGLPPVVPGAAAAQPTAAPG